MFTPFLVLAHPGDTDIYGCHYCWTNCGYWDLSYEQFHCHVPKETIPCPIQTVFREESDCQRYQDQLNQLLPAGEIPSWWSAAELGVYNMVKEPLEQCRKEVEEAKRQGIEYEKCKDAYFRQLNQYLIDQQIAHQNELNSTCATLFLNSYYDANRKDCFCKDGFLYFDPENKCLPISEWNVKMCKKKHGNLAIANGFDCICDNNSIYDSQLSQCILLPPPSSPVISIPPSPSLSPQFSSEETPNQGKFPQITTTTTTTTANSKLIENKIGKTNKKKLIEKNYIQESKLPSLNQSTSTQSVKNSDEETLNLEEIKKPILKEDSNKIIKKNSKVRVFFQNLKNTFNTIFKKLKFW